MAGLSISPPGVEVIQEFTEQSVTAVTPFLPTVFVGPCFQLVDAFDDNGNPQTEALAGTYRDGLGTIAYDLPSKRDQASLVGFETLMRVFLSFGSVVRELHSIYDEVEITTGTANYTFATRKLVDVAALFTQIGVEAGDVVRLTWRDESMDVEVEAVDNDTTLTLVVNIISENLSGKAYAVVRNPSEFLFDATVQANCEIGDAADYLRFTAATLKADGVTPGDYLGSAGDDLTLAILDSVHYLDGLDGVVGDSIFKSSTAAFLTTVGPRGAISGYYVQIGAFGAGQVLRDVLYAVSNTQLVIETGEGQGLTAQTFYVGTEEGVGSDGAVTLTTTFTSLTAAFAAPGAGYGNPPDVPWFIEIAGDGVYSVATVDSATQLTLASPATNAVGLTYTLVQQTATAANGATGRRGAVSDFSSMAVTLTAGLVGKAVNVDGLEAAVITGFTDADNVVLGVGLTAASEGPGLAFSVVDAVVALTLEWDVDNKKINVYLERTAGITGSTYAEIQDAVMDDGNPSYNEFVRDVIVSSLGGTTGTGLVTILEADLPIGLSFDGGSNDEQLLLDADLLGSTTPTAQVYVSYKALRVDTSDQATNPQMLLVENQTQREALLGAAVVGNPLSLAVYFGLINSPTRGIYALGVSAVSAAKPQGTVAAYTTAFEFLESKDVYCIVPLTLDLSVAQILQTHVDAMSQPAEKSERVGFFNSPLPGYTNATVVASGTTGNSAVMVGQNPADFSTSVDLVDADVQPGDILVVTALAAPTSELEAVNGTVGPLYGLVVVTPPVDPGDDFILHVDASGLTNTAWNNLVDVDWAVYRPGTAISQKSDEAEAVAQVGEGYTDRRLCHHWPDAATADVDSTEQLIDGYYVAAGWGGRSNEVPAEQGFSNTSIAGYLSLRHSFGYFSKSQLDRIAGGGTWITVQESQNAPLRCRHQLTTDTSSIEKREFSITRIVDYVAKYIRNGLNRQTGKFNITQDYLDGLGTAIQGLLQGLQESGKVVKADLLSVAVDEVQTDKINVVIGIDVAEPANYIQVTLQI